MANDLARVAALLLTTAILLVGQGLQGILLPVEAVRNGFSGMTVGLMGSFYFAGFVSGSLRGALLVRRVGHIRTFATLAIAASAVPLLHALFYEPALWIALRGVRMGGRNVVPRRPFLASPRTAATVFKLDPRAASDDGSRS